MDEGVSISKGTLVYWGRVVSKVNMFDVVPLKVHTVADAYFTGIDDVTKHTHLFEWGALGAYVFLSKEEANNYVDSRKEREFNPNLSSERDTNILE